MPLPIYSYSEIKNGVPYNAFTLTFFFIDSYTLELIILIYNNYSLFKDIEMLEEIKNKANKLISNVRIIVRYPQYEISKVIFWFNTD